MVKLFEMITHDDDAGAEIKETLWQKIREAR